MKLIIPLSPIRFAFLLGLIGLVLSVLKIGLDDWNMFSHFDVFNTLGSIVICVGFAFVFIYGVIKVGSFLSDHIEFKHEIQKNGDVK